MIQRLEGMVILAARTSMGKTSFALNVILNVLNAGKRVVFFSLEQPKEQVFERMLAISGDIPLEDIKMGIANPSVTLTKKMQKLFENLHVDDTANVANSYITSVSRQKKFEWGDVGLIVVDYLHLMKLNEKQTVEALGDAVKELRALGKELEAPVLLLAQLKRENDPSGKKGKRPDLSDLRSSGEIEQSADQVIFLHRESYYDLPGLAPDVDVTEVLVRKNRNGRQGIVMLEWLPKTTSFRDAR
jgi:replicative DNA helicase